MKNYYGILNLSSSSSSSTLLDPPALRRAYKAALLAAHPDKAPVSTGNLENSNGESTAYTVDDVKEAYMVLSDAGRRAEYDRWVLAHPHAHALEKGCGQEDAEDAEMDFVLGLEVLDLGDFKEESVTSTPTSNTSGSKNSRSGEGEQRMQWSRSCRCGAEKGFLITEEELENAEERGEKEVLVGCEGCSLWVRVGFEVEVEEG